jgi:hypothetical protein
MVMKGNFRLCLKTLLLSALFEDIIASNSGKASGSNSRVGNKGTRELNSLFSSINYDAHSGSASRGRRKVRDHRGCQ